MEVLAAAVAAADGRELSSLQEIKGGTVEHLAGRRTDRAAATARRAWLRSFAANRRLRAAGSD